MCTYTRASERGCTSIRNVCFLLIAAWNNKILQPTRSETRNVSGVQVSAVPLARALASCCKCEKSKVALGQCKRTVIPIYSARGPSFWYHASMRAWRGIKNIYTQHSLSLLRGAPLNWVHPRYILKPEVGLMHVVKTTASFFSSSDTSLVLCIKSVRPGWRFPLFFPKRERRACPVSHALMHAQERAKGCCADRWKFMRGTVFIHCCWRAKLAKSP